MSIYGEGRSLRDLQLEVNKRRSAMMHIDYKRGKEVPTMRWVINESDIIEKELNDVYRDAYLSRSGVNTSDSRDHTTHQRFGTSPVKDAYWGFTPSPSAKKLFTHPIPKYVNDMFSKKTIPSKNPNTVTFRRYPNLMPELERQYHNLDILVKALLGFPKTLGYKQGSHCAILNDAWVVNLKTQKENIMMEAFLKQFGVQEALKKAWEENKNTGGAMGIDVSEELADLLKVYTDAEEHMKKREADALESMTAYVKRYMDIRDERRKVTEKLSILKAKLASGSKQEEEEE